MNRSRVVFVSRSYYPDDPRLARQASALIAAGYRVDVICLHRPGSKEPAREQVDDVGVLRLGGSRARGTRARYVVEYAGFAAGAATALLRERRLERIALVQIANPPDALVVCALPVRVGGAAVVLDIHDLSPELYASKFGGSDPWPPGARLLAGVERLSTRFADHVLVAGELFRERLIERGLEPARVMSIPNGPDERIFRTEFRTERRSEKVVYHGSLFDRYGVRLALQALPLVREAFPDVRVEVWGDGPELEPLRAEAVALNLQSSITFHGAVPLRSIPALIADAGCGLSTLRSDVFTELAFPTKVAEYAQLGVPVAATRTRALARVFSDDAVAYSPPGDAHAFAQSVITLLRDPERAHAQAERARRAVSSILWSRHVDAYVDTIERTLQDRRPTPRRRKRMPTRNVARSRRP